MHWRQAVEFVRRVLDNVVTYGLKIPVLKYLILVNLEIVGGLKGAVREISTAFKELPPSR